MSDTLSRHKTAPPSDAPTLVLRALTDGSVSVRVVGPGDPLAVATGEEVAAGA